jgi:spore germination protein KC
MVTINQRKGGLQMRKKAIILIFILIPMLLQTGCWNGREINELAFVLSMGLDKTDIGFKITAQFAKPEIYSKSPSGSGTTNGKSFGLLTSTGKTIFDAIRNMASVSSRRVFWSHIKVIIISEQLAKESTLEIFDFFSRNPELRLRTLVAVTPGKASDLFNIVPTMEKDLAIYLEKVIQNKNLTGKSYDIMLKDFVEDYLDPNVGPVTSRIVIDKTGKEQLLKTSGAYFFDSNQLAGSLNEEETRGLLWIKNEMDTGIMVVKCPYDNLPVTLEIKSAKTSIESYFDNGTPYFIFKSKATATLTEQSCLTDFNDQKKMNELEKVLETAIKKDIQTTIIAAKDAGVDFLGLSRIMHRKNKEEWHKISTDWHELFKNTEVQIIVKAEIPNMSLAKPLEPIKTPYENE